MSGSLSVRAKPRLPTWLLMFYPFAFGLIGYGIFFASQLPFIMLTEPARPTIGLVFSCGAGSALAGIIVVAARHLFLRRVMRIRRQPSPSWIWPLGALLSVMACLSLFYLPLMDDDDLVTIVLFALRPVLLLTPVAYLDIQRGR